MATIKVVWKHETKHKGKVFFLNKKNKKGGGIEFQFEDAFSGKELSAKQGGVFTSIQKAKAAKWFNNKAQK